MVLRTDSYKVTHWPVLPEGTQYVYSYLESRGGMYPTTVFFGLQYYLKEYLSVPVTQADVDYAAIRFGKHFGDSKIFNYKDALQFLEGIFIFFLVSTI